MDYTEFSLLYWLIGILNICLVSLYGLIGLSINQNILILKYNQLTPPEILYLFLPLIVVAGLYIELYLTWNDIYNFKHKIISRINEIIDTKDSNNIIEKIQELKKAIEVYYNE